MNFFQAQLLYFFRGRPEFENAKYVGRSCFVPLSDGTKIKAEFITREIADMYEALKLTAMNKSEGQIDMTILNFKDYFGEVRGSISDPLTPHIWVYGGKAEWYGSPTYADKESIADAACEYVRLFDPEQEEGNDVEMSM